MSDRVLLTRDLNRALLARQFLLERSPVPLTRALESLAGLQTQYAPSAYIGLWSRLRDFRRGALTEALEQQGAVQATLMRGTIHTVSAEDFPLFAAGLRDGRRQWWLRVQQHQVEGLDMEAVASLLRERLARGPCRANDLKDLLSARGLPSVAWSGARLWLEMVRVPPSVPGSSGGLISTVSPTTGSALPSQQSPRAWSTSFAATSGASVRRP